jgi:hypothetical protein
MATVQSASTDNPQDGYAPPPKSPKERRFSSSKEPSKNGMFNSLSFRKVHNLEVGDKFCATLRDSKESRVIDMGLNCPIQLPRDLYITRSQQSTCVVVYIIIFQTDTKC